MKTTITSQNIEITPASREYAEEKVAKARRCPNTTITYVKPVISHMDDCHAGEDLGRCSGGSGADSGCVGGS